MSSKKNKTVCSAINEFIKETKKSRAKTVKLQRVKEFLTLVYKLHSNALCCEKQEKEDLKTKIIDLRHALDCIVHLAVTKDLQGNSSRLEEAVDIADNALGPLPKR